MVEKTMGVIASLSIEVVFCSVVAGISIKSLW